VSRSTVNCDAIFHIQEQIGGGDKMALKLAIKRSIQPRKDVGGILPLGPFPGSSYSAITKGLEPDDRIVLYTDGIVEATNPSEEQFGIGRLKSILREASVPTAGQFADAVLDGLARWTERSPGEGHSDDITLLAVDYHC
jgi:serine phosphatase RsbU (regulator of sigma subunit)